MNRDRRQKARRFPAPGLVPRFVLLRSTTESGPETGSLGRYVRSRYTAVHQESGGRHEG